ncbi:hypothetical protein TEQG_06630 [Trichophyton equinum CBS 127.97]|uniref:Uncharacterized protein n=1 Tax=Trichophyton equinum (strain ATCC MYA-4606 / CBS 127.97) TaxID=559882 RepID=F2Q0H8_TRIEC|nr:hypothetical protein TEQG_06630 [Trichophyton equinum CBS 127.97]
MGLSVATSHHEAVVVVQMTVSVWGKFLAAFEKRANAGRSKRAPRTNHGPPKSREHGLPLGPDAPFSMLLFASRSCLALYRLCPRFGGCPEPRKRLLVKKDAHEADGRAAGAV